jgi:porphobilinogen synthase
VSAFPAARPRGCGGPAPLRRLVSDVRLHPGDLILPMFVKEGIDAPAPIPSMPGVVQHTLDSLVKAAYEAVSAGVGGLILFGVPAAKDGRGSARRPVRDRAGGAAAAGRRGRHGHRADGRPVPGRVHRPRALRGAAADGSVDNDATLSRYASIASRRRPPAPR